MDLEKAKTALRNADAAGDVEAAKRLANFIKQSELQSSPVSPKENQGYIPEDPRLRDFAHTGLDQGLQGATFGFADEVTDRLGAGIASLATDQSYGDLLKEARSTTQDRLREQMQEMPVTSIAANIAGGVLTGGAAGTTKAGAATGNFIRSGNTAARIGKGVATGAATGAAYGAGTGEDGARGESAKSGALYGGALGGLGTGAVLGARKLNTKTIIPSSEAIRKKGGELFNLADQKGGVLKVDVADKFLDDVLSLRPQTDAGRVFKGQSPVTNILNEIPSLKGKPLTLQAAKEVDEALGDLAYGTMDKFGKLSSDGKKFLDMQTKLRRTIESADDTMVIGGKEGFEALKEARKYWSTSLRLRDIEKIIDNAQYFEQPATAIKTGFRTLLRNPNRLKGYSPAEVKAIKKAANTGIVTDLFRLAGSGLVPIGGGIAGMSAGGPAGGMAGAAGAYALQQGSKKIGTARQIGRAKDAAKAVAEKSGMVTTENRINLPLAEIMKLPPKEARRLLSIRNE